MCDPQQDGHLHFHAVEEGQLGGGAVPHRVHAKGVGALGVEGEGGQRAEGGSERVCRDRDPACAGGEKGGMTVGHALPTVITMRRPAGPSSLPPLDLEIWSFRAAINREGIMPPTYNTPGTPARR